MEFQKKKSKLSIISDLLINNLIKIFVHISEKPLFNILFVLFVIFFIFYHEYEQYLVIREVLEKNFLLNQQNGKLLLTLAQNKKELKVLEYTIKFVKSSTVRYKIDYIRGVSNLISFLIFFVWEEEVGTPFISRKNIGLLGVPPASSSYFSSVSGDFLFWFRL